MVATISGKSFSGPDVLNAVAGKVTDYPLKFLPLSEGADEVIAALCWTRCELLLPCMPTVYISQSKQKGVSNAKLN